MASSRKSNGEGSIYQRGDGRWVGSAYVDTVSGIRKRIHIYGKTRQVVHDRLEDKLAVARRGIRTPDKEWNISDYLDYWLANVVSIKDRETTAALYEANIRLYLKPSLGRIALSKLTVQKVQTMLNTHLSQGRSVRAVHLTRSVLRAALSRAEREELITRNVAKLVELPAWERAPIQPWSAPEAATFLATSRGHRWHLAYLMLLLYGMRRGEVLGLRWCDVSFELGQFHVHQQLQRIGKDLVQGPVKTAAGRRLLPLIGPLHDGLVDMYARRNACARENVAARAAGDTSLVFLSSTETPIDPKNFVRSFHEISRKAGLPYIKLHHTRHTAATMLKNLGVPARDAQLILGHAHVTTTQQLYQHADIEGQSQAIARVEQQLLASAVAVTTAVNVIESTGESTNFMRFTPGGPGGARTLDTLLKRNPLFTCSTLPTPVTSQLRTRAYGQILGVTAVLYCCQKERIKQQLRPIFSDPTSDLYMQGVRAIRISKDWGAVLRCLEQMETAEATAHAFGLPREPIITSDPPADEGSSDPRTTGTAHEGAAA